MRDRMFRHPWHLFWIALAYLPWLGRISVPLTGDQKLYLRIALEMRERGSWLKPLLLGEACYHKPPLLYWVTLLSWNTFGEGLFSALFPSVLALILTAWFIGEISAALGGKRKNINAGLWLAVTIGAVTYGTVGQMEIWTGLFQAAAWWAGLKYLAAPHEQRKSGWLLGAFVIAGASSLVKSPLYSVFWVAGYVSYLIVSGEWELFAKKRLYGSLAVGILVGLSWFLAMLAIDGDHFWREYFLQETVGKSTGNGSTPLQFWAALALLAFPLTLLCLPALRALRTLRKAGAMARLLACWSWPAAVFFTIYPYRVHAYLYFFVPALAIVVDWTLGRMGRTRPLKIARHLTAALFALITGAFGILLLRTELVPAWICAGFWLAGAMALFFSAIGKTRGLLAGALVGILAFRLAAISFGENDLAELRDYVRRNPRQELAMLDPDRNVWHEGGLLSIALGARIQTLRDTDGLSKHLESGGTAILTLEQLTDFQPLFGATRLNRDRWRRLRPRKDFPYRELALHGASGTPDFEERIYRSYWIVSLKSGT